MNFVEYQPKGLARFLADADLPSERLRIHISEVGPGARSHPPHTHEGVEYEGTAGTQIGMEKQLLPLTEP